MRDVVVTRVPYGGPRRSRTLEERFLVRFPSLYRRLAALVFNRLSPRSRLRRALVRRAIVSGWGAFQRQDFDLILVRYAPEIVYEFNPGMQTLGLDGSFRGHEGLREALGKFIEVWDHFEFEPAYVLDLGDQLLSIGFNHSRARGSGVELDVEFAQLATAPSGLVTHQQSFFSWDEGLRAAGLNPDAIVLPSRRRTGQATSSAT
jgi:SnoaL-like domain